MPFDVKTNPLLEPAGLARFDIITPEHITPAIDTLLGHCRAAVARVTDAAAPASWETVVEPLDDALDRLGRAGHVRSSGRGRAGDQDLAPVQGERRRP